MTRYQPTAEECRKGGRRRAARPDWKAAQQTGGQHRAAQPAFLQHNATIAPLGYAAAVAKWGWPCIVEKICAKRRKAAGSRLEQFVEATLRDLGLVEGDPDAAIPGDFVREIRVDLPDPPYLATLDFVVNAPEGVVVILPGARRFHGGPAETIDGRDRAARDRTIDRQLRACGWQVLRLDDVQIRTQPAEVRAAIATAVLGAPGQVAA